MHTSNDVTPLPIVEDSASIYRGNRQTTDPHQPADPDNPDWGAFSALSVWFFSFLLVLFMPVLLVIPYASYRGIHFGMPNYLPALGEFASNDKSAVLLEILALLPTHLLTFAMVWAIVTRFGRRSFKDAIGLTWSVNVPWWADLMLGIGLGIFLFAVGSVIAWWFGTEKPTPLEQIIKSSLAARYAISFLAVFTAPFAEEFIYRGVLYSALRKTLGVYGGWLLASIFGTRVDRNLQDRFGVYGAVVIVLALFTVIHVPQYWPNFGVIAAVALLSIALTLVRAYSGRLLPCIVIHTVFNGIQALILILQPYFERFLSTPKPLPPAAGLLLSIVNFHL